MAITNKGIVGLCAVTTVIGGAIGYVLGMRKGYKMCANENGEEEIVYVSKEKAEPEHKPEAAGECTGCAESNESEQEDEESEEVIKEITKTGIQQIDEDEVATYMDLDYNMENLDYYPEDERLCDTLLSDDGKLDDMDILSKLGTDMETIKAKVEMSTYSPSGCDVLYFANHDDMTVYSIETMPGQRGVYEEEKNYPELV